MEECGLKKHRLLKYLVLIGRDRGLSTLCHSCQFAFQQRVLKTFPCTGYLHSEDGVVCLWYLLVNLYIYVYIYIYIYIWVTISTCYGSIPLSLVLIERDCGLITLCIVAGFLVSRGC